MHKTSTTTLSTALEHMQEWDSRLDEYSWLPIEQLMDILVNVGVIVTHITETTSDSMFTDEEIELMFAVTKKAERISNEILLSQQNEEGDS